MGLVAFSTEWTIQNPTEYGPRSERTTILPTSHLLRLQNLGCVASNQQPNFGVDSLQVWSAIDVALISYALARDR